MEAVINRLRSGEKALWRSLHSAHIVSKMAEVHGNRTNAGITGKTVVDFQSGAESGALEADLSSIDPELQAIIDAWPDLSDVTRAGILAMLDEDSHT